jgi:hypothetical protein
MDGAAFAAPLAACAALAKALTDRAAFAKQLTAYHAQLGGASPQPPLPSSLTVDGLDLHALLLHVLGAGGSAALCDEVGWASAAAAAAASGSKAAASVDRLPAALTAASVWKMRLLGFESVFLKRLAAKFAAPK